MFLIDGISKLNSAFLVHGTHSDGSGCHARCHLLITTFGVQPLPKDTLIQIAKCPALPTSRHREKKSNQNNNNDNVKTLSLARSSAPSASFVLLRSFTSGQSRSSESNARHMWDTHPTQSSVSFVWARRCSMRRGECHFSGLSRRLVHRGPSRGKRDCNKTDCSIRVGMVWDCLQMISLYHRWGCVLAWSVSRCVCHSGRGLQVWETYPHARRYGHGETNVNMDWVIVGECGISR